MGTSIFDHRRNYLRVRGEYIRSAHSRARRVELPPRARRIHHRHLPPPPRGRTTSACAENTETWWTITFYMRNYLRVRGEYSSALPKAAVTVELPPRARRIRLPAPGEQGQSGTTSACAENTYRYKATASSDWNYLRVRGEYQPENVP